jgi:hypothetical protein
MTFAFLFDLAKIPSVQRKYSFILCEQEPRHVIDKAAIHEVMKKIFLNKCKTHGRMRIFSFKRRCVTNGFVIGAQASQCVIPKGKAYYYSSDCQSEEYAKVFR